MAETSERKPTAEESIPDTVEALGKLEEQLTCSHCHKLYENPKLLRCFHVFCANCLKPEGKTVNCPDPKCGRTTSLPSDGIAGLQSAFHVDHLFGIQDTLKKASNPAENQCAECDKRTVSCYCRACGFICDWCKHVHEQMKRFSTHEVVSLDQLKEDATRSIPSSMKQLQCSLHSGKELELYCESCKVLACHECAVQTHRNHQHNLSLVRDAFPKHKDVIVASLQPVEQQLASVNKALEGLDVQCSLLNEQNKAIKVEIHQSIELLQLSLDQREKFLFQQLEEATQHKMKSLAAQRDQLELVATRLKSCQQFVQESLKTGSQGEILMMKSVVDSIKKITAEIESVVDVHVPADLKFSHSEDELTQTFQKFGKVFFSSQAFPEKCCAEGSGLQVAKVRETATATVYVVDQEGTECQRPVEVSCELVSSDGSSRVRGKVKNVKSDQYLISYQPERRGRHQLHIRVEDTHISGSPFTTAVFQESTVVQLGSVDARGVGMNQRRQIIVSASGSHAISIYTDKGKEVRKFGKKGSAPGELDNPKGVAITATDDILVCDYSNNRIQLFSAAGTFVKSIGSEGNGPLQFNKPVGIAVHPHSGKVYVTEEDNHRVQILTAELTFSTCFGSKGTSNGQFICPLDVAFDSTGHVYVADRDNLRIQVFSESGGFVRKLGWKGETEGELSSPCGIAIDSSDLVYVSEQDRNCISIFTRNGKFLKSLAINGNGLFGISVDKDGLVCGVHYYGYGTSSHVFYL